MPPIDIDATAIAKWRQWRPQRLTQRPHEPELFARLRALDPVRYKLGLPWRSPF